MMVVQPRVGAVDVDLLANVNFELRVVTSLARDDPCWYDRHVRTPAAGDNDQDHLPTSCLEHSTQVVCIVVFFLFNFLHFWYEFL